MSYFEPVVPQGPIDYFEQYDRYRYEHPEYPGMPLKEDDYWDLIAPTSDTQTMSRVRYTAPLNDEYSPDAFWATDPILRGPLAEALSEAKGDTIGAYDVINTPDYREALRKRIGKTEWNQLREAGILPKDDLPGEQLDEMALDYYMKGLENSLATGAPTMRRNAGVLDELSQRYGGRPYPGGELAGFEGPGFGGVGSEGGQGGPRQGPSQTFTNLVGDEAGGEQVRAMYLDALYRRMGKEARRARSTTSDYSRQVRQKRNRQRENQGERRVRRGVRNISPAFGSGRSRSANKARKAKARLMRTRNR